MAAGGVAEPVVGPGGPAGFVSPHVVEDILQSPDENGRSWGRSLTCFASPVVFVHSVSPTLLHDFVLASESGRQVYFRSSFEY